MSFHEELPLLDRKVMTTSIAVSGEPEQDKEGDDDDHRTEIVVQEDDSVSMVSSLGSYSAAMGDDTAAARQKYLVTTTSGLLKWLLRKSSAIVEHEKEGTAQHDAKKVSAAAGAGRAGGVTIPMDSADSKAQSQSLSQQEQSQQETSAPTGTRTLTSSVMGEATALAAHAASSSVPPEDFVTLFQVLELMERDLEEERAASQALREENDELVNDNHELVDHQKELESQLEQTKEERGSLGQEHQEMQEELERLQGRQLNHAWESSSNCSSLLMNQKVQDKTTQIEQRARAALNDKYMLEERLRSLQHELNQTHTAAETLLKQRNAFELKAKKLEKHMKKCSCQDPLVLMPDGQHSFGPGSFRRRRSSSCTNTPSRRMVPRCVSNTMKSISMRSTIKTSRAGQHLHSTISSGGGVSENRRMKFAASKIQHHHQPAEIAEEGNLESRLRMSWRLIKKGVGSGAEDVDNISSGEDKPHAKKSKQKQRSFSLNQSRSQDEKEDDDQFENMIDGPAAQEKDTEGSSRPTKKMFRRRNSLFFVRRTPASLLHSGDSDSHSQQEDVIEGTAGKQDTVDSIVLGLAQELGIPFDHDASDHKEALREVLVATSSAAFVVDDDVPQDGAANEKYQAAPASVEKIPSRGASKIQKSHKKKTGYARWSNEDTSGTWSPTVEEPTQTKMKQAAYSFNTNSHPNKSETQSGHGSSIDAAPSTTEKGDKTDVDETRTAESSCSTGLEYSNDHHDRGNIPLQ
jgi:hypothetical protein